MQRAMHNYSKESMIGGAIGAIISLKFWLLQVTSSNIAPETFKIFMSDFMFKLFGTIILAVIGSALAPLGRDFYKYKIKLKLFPGRND